jgi:Tol biopolymer transport system component
MNADAGKVLGKPVALTEDAAVTAYPSISTDGKKLAFVSDSSGRNKVWIMNVDTHQRLLLTPAQTTEFRPILSPDGTKMAFHSSVDGRHAKTMVADVSSVDQPGSAHTVCEEGCYPAWDWWWDNRGFLASFGPDNKRIGYIPADGGGPVEFVSSKTDLYQSHPSPDGHWLLIMGPGSANVTPIADGKPPIPDHWKPVVRGNSNLQRWSPDGNTVYFISHRDRYRCIWAQRLNPATKDPVGEPFAIYHDHGARLSMQALVDTGAVGLDVARDKIVFTQVERTGNIWLGKVDLQ